MNFLGVSFASFQIFSFTTISLEFNSYKWSRLSWFEHFTCEHPQFLHLWFWSKQQLFLHGHPSTHWWTSSGHFLFAGDWSTDWTVDELTAKEAIVSKYLSIRTRSERWNDYLVSNFSLLVTVEYVHLPRNERIGSSNLKIFCAGHTLSFGLYGVQLISSTR